MRPLQRASDVSARDKELLRQLKAVIHRFLPTASVMLYGSVARGTQDSESDYDILVLTDAALTPDEQDEIRGGVFDFELPRQVVFSLIFRSWDQWKTPPTNGSPFHANVQRDGILV